MMFGAKTLKDIVFPIESRLSQDAARLQRRTIAASWNALSYRDPQSSRLHVPAVLPLPSSEARPVVLSATEQLAAEWLARENVKAAMIRRGRKPLLRHGANGSTKLPTMAVPASQLWPAEVRLAAGFQLVEPNKRGETRTDWSNATLEQLAATATR